MQWALSSEEIDMAIICKEAAKKFIQYDENFEIVCPVVKNSDVFILKNENPESIGITQNRNYQIDLVNKYYKKSKPIPLINSALIYALENNNVEGVLVDAIRTLNLEGEKYSTTENGDYDTYVIVVNKSFKDTSLYEKFVDLYNESVKEISNNKILKKELERYTDKKLTNKDMGDIEKWKLEFLQIKQ